MRAQCLTHARRSLFRPASARALSSSGMLSARSRWRCPRCCRLTDQRFLASPDPTVRTQSSRPSRAHTTPQLGVEFGSKLISIPDEDKTVKLQCWVRLVLSRMPVDAMDQTSGHCRYRGKSPLRRPDVSHARQSPCPS